MISHKHKCVFIHIPKTAGTSIEKKLGCFNQLKINVQDHRTIQHLEPKSPAHRTKCALTLFKSIEWKEGSKCLLKIAIPPISRKNYYNYYKFSFVRNSWARVYSWYRNVLRDKNHQTALKITSDLSLLEFIRNYHNSWAMQSQLSWLTDSKGNIPLDFIGRFEKLHNDFSYVCKQLQIEDDTLPALLISGNPPYTDAYDEKTKDLVYKIYHNEIKKFKFEYGE